MRGHGCMDRAQRCSCAQVARYVWLGDVHTISRKKASRRQAAGSQASSTLAKINRGYAMQGRVGRKMRVQELATRWER
jgi:hypothetical protein